MIGEMGGMEMGMEIGARKGAWERTVTSGVGERGGVSPRTEPSSSELSLSDSLSLGRMMG